MSVKISAEQRKTAGTLLARLDKIAADVQANHEAWGLSFEAAKNIVNHLDKVADDLESGVFGAESLQRRQAELLAKTAQVIQQDTDEAYMKAFQVDQGVIQAEGDEPYMQAYSDDQSSAVRGGKATNGRPLCP